MLISFYAISSLCFFVLYSPFGQNCFQYEGNDLSSQILQSCRFSAKKKKNNKKHQMMETVLSQWLLTHNIVIWRTPVKTHISAKMETNKQRNKRMGDYKSRMLLKAIWVICLFQRQPLGIESAAIESSIAYCWFLKERRLSSLKKLLMLSIKFSRLLATSPQHSHLPS